MVTLSQAVAAIQESLSTTPGQESVAIDIGVEFLTQAPNGALLPHLMAFVAAPGEAVATVRIELKARQSSPYAFPPSGYAGGTTRASGTGGPFSPVPSPMPQPGPGQGGPFSIPVANPNPPNSSGFPNVTSPGPSAGGDDDEY